MTQAELLTLIAEALELLASGRVQRAVDLLKRAK